MKEIKDHEHEFKIQDMKDALKETQRIAGTYQEAREDGEAALEERNDICEVICDN